MTTSPRVLIAGASGYTGALAAALINRHPSFELAAVTTRSDVGRSLADLYPQHGLDIQLQELDIDRHGKTVDAAIVAYPHGAAAPVVSELRAKGIRVVDLSADFRLVDQNLYESWYGEHGAPALFGQGVYGLTEYYREQIQTADLVANPGCYPTATLLALMPLAQAGLLENVIVDAKSGLTGAGRTLTEQTHFVQANENVSPYAVGGHRHLPEIQQELTVAGVRPELVFVPHLVPLNQGELVSCYVKLTSTQQQIRTQTDLDTLYRNAYEDEHFVELATQPPQISDVAFSNRCRLLPIFDETTATVMVFAVIDNLWKGASGQAVQNLNVMFDFPETEGLL